MGRTYTFKTINPGLNSRYDCSAFKYFFNLPRIEITVGFQRKSPFFQDELIRLEEKFFQHGCFLLNWKYAID